MDCSPSLETMDTSVIKIIGKDVQNCEEKVVIEKALTVYLNDKEFMTIVCSPGQEKELVIGFLCSEGIINEPSQIAKISIDIREGFVWVETKEENNLGENLFLKRYLTSCCGKGRTSFCFANDARLTKKVESPLRISADDVRYYMNLLDEKSDLFRQTGGVHGGALASGGEFQCFAFDIGRHNVLDKLYGQAFINGIDLSQKVIVFSGRISSEILIKTGKMRCPILAGVSAPTNLALGLAEELGITVIGFARKDRMNVYTHSERIIVP
jgi:FdhD protein